MVNSFTPRNASIIMICLLSATIVFHLLIIIQIIPFNIVWAGKLSSVEEMWVFETVSLLLNALLLIVILSKGNFIPNYFSAKALNFFLWVFVVVFALNTIGNLTAETTLETVLGSLLTFVSSVLCWVIVRKAHKLIQPQDQENISIR